MATLERIAVECTVGATLVVARIAAGDDRHGLLAIRAGTSPRGAQRILRHRPYQ